MERKHAMALGLTRYNTGRPCRHGHAVDRYTASGACSACLAAMMRQRAPKPARVAVPRETREVLQARREVMLSEVTAGTTDIYLHVHGDDLATVQEAAYAICAVRFPDALRSMFRPARGDRRVAGPDFYRITVRVPQPDVAAVYEMAREMAAKRQPAPDFEEARRRVLEGAK